MIHARGTDPARDAYTRLRYVAVKYMRNADRLHDNATDATDDKEWKKGSAELLILSLLEDRPRHGYEIAKLIEGRSGGTLRFRVTSLYPLLYRLEERGLVDGRWVERVAQRRRRYYRLTGDGRALLERQRQSWKAFVEAVRRVTGIDYA